MGTYRNSKTLQNRGPAGRFRRWDLDRDFGVRLCPWCNTLSATRPEIPAYGFIDPAEFNARVCTCGYDSRRGTVSYFDFHRALGRAREALRHVSGAEGADEETIEILAYQLRRECRLAESLEWLSDGGPS